MSSRPPISEPTTTALNDAHQLSPNAIGNQPMTNRLNVRQLPCRMKKRLTGRDLRSSSGMCSMPNRSMSNVRSSTSSGSLGSNSGPCGVSVDMWVPLPSAPSRTRGSGRTPIRRRCCGSPTTRSALSSTYEAVQLLAEDVFRERVGSKASTASSSVRGSTLTPSSASCSSLCSYMFSGDRVARIEVVLDPLQPGRRARSAAARYGLHEVSTARDSTRPPPIGMRSMCVRLLRAVRDVDRRPREACHRAAS